MFDIKAMEVSMQEVDEEMEQVTKELADLFASQKKGLKKIINKHAKRISRI